MNRDKALQSIRPQIPSIIDENATSTAEQFQNRTLRPILKLQNDLLVAMFRSYAYQRKGTFFELNDSKKLAYIQQSLQNDQRFKNSMLGVVVGQFTLAEWEVFESDMREFRRRTTEMMIQRLQDQMEFILP